MLTPRRWLDKRPGASIRGILRNWALVFVGNFPGALTVAGMMAFIFTPWLFRRPTRSGRRSAHIGEARTLGYAQYGLMGWVTIFCAACCATDGLHRRGRRYDLHHRQRQKGHRHGMPIMLFFGLSFWACFCRADAGRQFRRWTIISGTKSRWCGQSGGFTGLTLYTTHARTAPQRALG